MPTGDAGLSFVEGNAEALPFDDASFDSYTIAFGIRNVTDRPAALREALRVLKPGGRCAQGPWKHAKRVHSPTQAPSWAVAVAFPPNAMVGAQSS